MLYRDFQQETYEQSSMSLRYAEIKGHKEVYQKEIWATHSKFWDQEGKESDM